MDMPRTRRQKKEGKIIMDVTTSETEGYLIRSFAHLFLYLISPSLIFPPTWLLLFHLRVLNCPPTYPTYTYPSLRPPASLQVWSLIFKSRAAFAWRSCFSIASPLCPLLLSPAKTRKGGGEGTIHWGRKGGAGGLHGLQENWGWLLITWDEAYMCPQ